MLDALGRTLVTAAGCIVVAAACGDDPLGSRDWELSPDTATIYALDRPELGLASGFDFINGQTVRIEAPDATGRWDIVLDREGGELILLPPASLGVTSQARIAIFRDTTFSQIREAPSDTTVFSGAEPVPVREDAVYVVRTHQRLNFSRSCVQYAKFIALDADPELGFLRFQWDANPFCNDRALVPPGTD